MICPKCKCSEEIWVQNAELVRKAVYFDFGVMQFAKDVDVRRIPLLQARPQYYCSNCKEEFNADA